MLDFEKNKNINQFQVIRYKLSKKSTAGKNLCIFNIINKQIQ
jgi:hypothetical protein